MEETKEKTKIETKYLEGEIQIDWKTAFAAFEDLADEMTGEIIAITSDTKIRNTYSPRTWANLCWTLRYYIDAMRSARMHCEGKKTGAIASELGLNVNRVRAFVAWNTMRGHELDAKLKVEGTTKDDQLAYENFLTTIGIRVREKMSR